MKKKKGKSRGKKKKGTVYQGPHKHSKTNWSVTLFQDGGKHQAPGMKKRNTGIKTVA